MQKGECLIDRNTVSHFGATPSLDMQRSKFPLSHNVKFSGNTGDLIPFDFWEVLPGDTFSVDTNKVVRLQTMLTPIMDNMYLDVYWFYAPNRILWDHWKQFCGESDRAWTPSTTYTIPQLVQETAEDGFPTGSIADYLGIPTFEFMPHIGQSCLSVSALPFRMYAQVVNEWFRDQNLIDPLYCPTGDAREIGFTTHEIPYTPNSYVRGGMPFRAAKMHDVFTSALPAPQKGPDVMMPGGSVMLQAPVITNDTYIDNPFQTALPLKFTKTSGMSGIKFRLKQGDNEAVQTTTSDTGSLVPRNLMVDATGYEQLNQVTLGSINQLRMAFQIQKLLEADARGGTRYREILKQHFGTDSPDATQQIPEYLGGNRIPIVVHQIANTGETAEAKLGNVGGMSVTTDSHFDFQKSFTEAGLVMGFAVVRYDHSYSQGLQKYWSKRSRYEFYWPELANIGEQAIKTYELDCRHGNVDAAGENPQANSVFGYQEAWYDYRYLPDRVSGEMRPGISNTLSSWHLADYYEEQPSLSEEWINEDKSNVDRVLAVSSSVANQYWADFYIKVEATRVMPVYSIPGLADHH